MISQRAAAAVVVVVVVVVVGPLLPGVVKAGQMMLEL